MTHSDDLSQFKQYRGSTGAPVNTDLAVLLHKISTLLEAPEDGAGDASENALQNILESFILLKTVLTSNTARTTTDLSLVKSAVESLQVAFGAIGNNTSNIQSGINTIINLGANTKETTQLQHISLLTDLRTKLQSLIALSTTINTSTSAIRTTLSDTGTGLATEATQLAVKASVNSIIPNINGIEDILIEVSDTSEALAEAVEVLDTEASSVNNKLGTLNTSIGVSLAESLASIQDILEELGDDSSGRTVPQTPIIIDNTDPVTNTFLDNIEDLNLQANKLDEVIVLLGNIKSCVCGNSGSGDDSESSLTTLITEINAFETLVQERLTAILTAINNIDGESLGAVTVEDSTVVQAIEDLQLALLTKMNECCFYLETLNNPPCRKRVVFKHLITNTLDDVRYFYNLYWFKLKVLSGSVFYEAKYYLEGEELYFPPVDNILYNTVSFSFGDQFSSCEVVMSPKCDSGEEYIDVVLVYKVMYNDRADFYLKVGTQTRFLGSLGEEDSFEQESTKHIFLTNLGHGKYRCMFRKGLIQVINDTNTAFENRYTQMSIFAHISTDTTSTYSYLAVEDSFPVEETFTIPEIMPGDWQDYAYQNWYKHEAWHRRDNEIPPLNPCMAAYWAFPMGNLTYRYSNMLITQNIGTNCDFTQFYDHWRTNYDISDPNTIDDYSIPENIFFANTSLSIRRFSYTPEPPTETQVAQCFTNFVGTHAYPLPRVASLTDYPSAYALSLVAISAYYETY